MALHDGESEAHHRAIVEAAIDAILAIDEAGNVQSFNPAASKLFGYPAEEVMGRNVSLLMPSPYREEHDGYIQRYVRTGDKRIIGIGREVVGRRKDGTTFPMHLSVAEVPGERRLFAGIIRDLTEKKVIEDAREALLEQLERTNAELERFTYTVSHDLKSPLITIKGFVGMLAKDAAAGNHERMRRDIERIGSAADKMQHLLDDLLALSRVGRVVSPPERVALTDLAREVLQMLAGPIAERGANVRIVEPLPAIWGDRVRLREVLQNLIENALKFPVSGGAPTVEIGSRTDDAQTVCYVRDEGLGVEARYQDKIFGLFEQLEKGTTGTGIGLALVQRILEFHGGRIWVESEGAGHGATFCFTVPEPPEAP